MSISQAAFHLAKVSPGSHPFDGVDIQRTPSATSSMTSDVDIIPDAVEVVRDLETNDVFSNDTTLTASTPETAKKRPRVSTQEMSMYFPDTPPSHKAHKVLWSQPHCAEWRQASNLRPSDPLNLRCHD